jgi:acyl carrier protein
MEDFMQPDRAGLVAELKQLIFEAVNLKHLDPATVDETTSLMQSGLELDSIDILEIVVAVEKRFKVTIKDGEEGQRAFRTLGTIADFIEASRS